MMHRHILALINSKSNFMNIHQFLDDLKQFSKANSIDEITALCRFHAEQLGFDNFIYALRIPTQFSEARIIMIKGYPDEWLTHYFERAFYDNDPVIDYCSKSLIPIQWHDLQIEKASLRERVMNEATEFGLKTGISMPVHSPRGEFGIFSLSVNSRLIAAQEITVQAIPYVQIMASYLHEALCRVIGMANSIEKPLLTDREKECLRLTADGKTSWEIGQLLNLSERTANFHINNAMIKLDVSNRQHAVAKSILQGLINPHPF